jgi:hypothetical protein
MRIFLSCQQALRPHPVPAYAFWEYYFKNALAEAGHEVIQTPGADWAEGLTSLSREGRAAWLESTWTKTVDFLRAEHLRKPVDLFLGYLFPDQIEASAVQAIRSAGIPTVNFFCDNMREFTEVPASFKAFDLHWVPEAEARAMYTSIAAPFVYAPMPMWVQPELRNLPARETDAVIFVGSRDDMREELLGQAVARGLGVRIYGAGWNDGAQRKERPARSISRIFASQVELLGREGITAWARRATYRFRKRRPSDWIKGHSAPPVVGDDYFTVTRDSQIVIGINRCPTFRRPFSNPLRYSRLRDIEAPMLGACYLTEMAPGLEDLYEIGTEIETYRDANELVEQAALLQRDAAKRRGLRERGRRRALADHTIRRSLERIAQKLGISA